MIMNKNKNNELYVLERFNRREAEAFGKVYSLFYTELIHFTTKLYSDTEVTPSDVIHDIFVNLWQSEKQVFNDLINIKAYIYKSIKNSFSNYIRHKKYIDKYRSEIITDNDTFTVEIIESEVCSLVNQALDMLPSDCAEIVKLYIEGWDIKEISDNLNIPKRTVYNRKNEAITILKLKNKSGKLL